MARGAGLNRVAIGARRDAAVLPAASSAGVRMRAASRGILVLLLARGDRSLAALRRRDPSASSAPSTSAARKPAAANRAWAAPPAATARDTRCRGFPCWCRQCRRMMPSMIFSSKVLSSSSSSAARGGAGCHHEANAQHGDGELQRPPAGRRRVCTIQKLASVSRIALFLFKISQGGRRLEARNSAPRVRIGRDQGAFAAGTPRKESYNRAATPATMATSARLNTYQLKVFPRSRRETGQNRPPRHRQSGRWRCRWRRR